MSRCLLLIFLITVVSVRSEENQIDDGAIKLFQSIGDHFRFSDQYSSLCSITSNDGKGNIKTQNYKMFVKDAGQVFFIRCHLRGTGEKCI
jgi:hypothetical protein